jgi:hypothetical protein
MGEGKNGKEGEVGTDPLLLVGGMKAEKPRKEGEEEEGGHREGDGEQKQSAQRFKPDRRGGMGIRTVADFGQAKQVAPGMEGDEVGADADQGWSQGEEEKKEAGFDPLHLFGAGGEGEQEGKDEQPLE